MPLLKVKIYLLNLHYSKMTYLVSSVVFVDLSLLLTS